MAFEKMRLSAVSVPRKKLIARFLVYLFFACALITISIFSPHLAPNDPYKTNVLIMKQAPNAQYPCGTDSLGRCVLSRVLYGAKTSIFSALVLVAVMFTTGTLLGILCGYFGGALDSAIMRIADTLLAFPQMVIAIAVAGILGGSLLNAMISLGATGWTSYARIARSRVVAMKNESYIHAARLSGNKTPRILIFYILPNVLGPLVVNATLQISATMLNLAGMSFLGLGVQVPLAEWGSMINESRGALQLAPWAVLAPGCAILITVMVFNLLGDTTRDLLDVNSTRTTAK